MSLQLPALAVLGLVKVDVERTTSCAPDARSAGGTCLFLGDEVVLVCLVFEFQSYLQDRKRHSFIFF